MSERQVLSVSQLNRQVRMLLETQYPLLWIEGELSNLARPSSGHWYFTLKDRNAQVRCAMFKGRNSRVQFQPTEGQQVVIRAKVGLYEGRGDFQLIAEHMEEAGFGALQRAFEELKQRLAHEGLFAPEYKKPLPDAPQRIGVVTSPTGAAIHDILTVLARRYPSATVTVLPVAVQGSDAAPQISRAIAEANHSQCCDVLIVGRGGGSLEDLWAFNEECVARAIFASHIPIVSAVGHEVDFSIADFVADVRAATPSAAAELVSPDSEDWLQTFEGFEILLKQAMLRKIETQQQKTLWLHQRLRHPGERLRENQQRLDQLEIRLQRAGTQRIQQQQQRLTLLTQQFSHLHPERQIAKLKDKLEQQQTALLSAIKHKIEQQQQRFAKQAALLDSVSPLSILNRGYSIAKNENGKVLRHAQELNEGERLITVLAEGQVESIVARINPSGA